MNDHERRMTEAMAGEHRLRFVGTGPSVMGRCSCEMWVEFGRSHLGSKRAAIKREHARHVDLCRKATRLR